MANSILAVGLILMDLVIHFGYISETTGALIMGMVALSVSVAAGEEIDKLKNRLSKLENNNE